MTLDLDKLDEDPKELPTASSRIKPSFGKLSECQRYYALLGEDEFEVFDAQTHLKLSSANIERINGVIINSDFCITVSYEK